MNEFSGEEQKSYDDLKMEVEALMESTPDAIYTADKEGNFISVNSVFEKMFGLGTHFRGKNIKMLSDQGKYPETVTLMAIDQKKSITLTQELTKDQHLLITSYPMVENGEITFVVTKIRDITELNKMKDELDKIKRLTTNYYNELTILRERYTQQRNVIVQSEKMKIIFELACRVAVVDTIVLVRGESGVGKEVIAKTIHNESLRKEGPFIKINCGAIPENLLESELFGYVKGAFTGANKNGKVGLFEVANGGTLLLDEIGEMPANLQVKLLRVLQDGEYYPLGEIKPTIADVRIIAATNRNLEEMVKNKLFRQDLYYRLKVVEIEIPSLRERKEDIIPLIYSFLEKFNKKYNFNKEINSDAIEILLEYNWPGNIRELENTVEYLVVISQGNTITKETVPRNIYEYHESSSNVSSVSPLKQAVNDLEKKLIQRAFEQYGDIEKVAEALKVHRTTVLRKMKKH
ncbi:MAG: sigma-54 interaction domain-containing protein [Eubacteriales bacterium]